VVISIFLSQWITPIHQRARAAWLYTGEDDATWLECGHGIDLSMKVMDMMLSKLSSNPISNEVINPPPSYLPIFMDQVARSKLL
jgi:hypothetical protein